MARLIPSIVLGVLLATPSPSSAHVVLDPGLVHGILVEIARFHKESREGPTLEARVEALYQLGEQAQGLNELMNQDLFSHGKSDPFTQLLLKRLEAYQVRITFSERARRYAYDLAAFRDYLRQAPHGRRAAGARFQLIARTFYETLGAEPAELVNTDVAGLMRAAAEEERFLKEYPQDGRAREVRFFLAVDYYRLLRNMTDPDRVKEYERRARQALEDVTQRYPGTMEARAAETLLERLTRP